MKKLIILMTAGALLLSAVPVSAESNESRINEIESQIAELEAELKELKSNESVSETDGEVIGTTYTVDNLDITINDIYFTDERNEYVDDTYDNVLVVSYTLVNNRDEDYPGGSEIKVFNGANDSENYYLPNTSTDSTVTSAGRQTEVVKGFGFNGEIEDIELEIKAFLGDDKEIVSVDASQIGIK